MFKIKIETETEIKIWYDMIWYDMIWYDMMDVGCTWQNMINKNKKQMMTKNLSFIINYQLSNVWRSNTIDITDHPVQ